MPVDIKRALEDKAYLDSLTEAERKEFLRKSKKLGDAELKHVAGGAANFDGEVKSPPPKPKL